LENATFTSFIKNLELPRLKMFDSSDKIDLGQTKWQTKIIINTQHRSFGLSDFQLMLCIYNKLCSHAEILSWWAFDATFPWIQPSEVQSLSFERE